MYYKQLERALKCSKYSVKQPNSYSLKLFPIFQLFSPFCFSMKVIFGHYR